MTHSVELRERVVAYYDNNPKVPVHEISRIFNVSTASIYRWRDLNWFNGSVRPKPAAGGPKPVMDETHLAVLATLLKTHPEATLAQKIELFETRTQRQVSKSTMRRALKRLKEVEKEVHIP